MLSSTILSFSLNVFFFSWLADTFYSSYYFPPQVIEQSMLLFSFGITNQINTVECLNVFILVTKISLKHSPNSCFDLELQSKKYCTVQGSTMKTTSFLQCRTCLLAKTATKPWASLSHGRQTVGKKKRRRKQRLGLVLVPFLTPPLLQAPYFCSRVSKGEEREGKRPEREGGEFVCVLLAIAASGGWSGIIAWEDREGNKNE